MKGNNKKILLIGIILIGILFSIGGTISYLIWNSDSGQDTPISFIAEGNGSCKITGSNSINNNVTLIPTNCSNSEHVIKKEIIANIDNKSSSGLYLNLWLEVNEIGSYLSDTSNFRYALTTGGSSCSDGVIYSGNFKDIQSGNNKNLIIGSEFNTIGLTNNTYYLWIWLDENETVLPPEDVSARSFNLSLNGECTTVRPDTRFEITNISSNYQIINATAVNFDNDIVSYAVTSSNVVPVMSSDKNAKVSSLVNNNLDNSVRGIANNWIDIPNAERNKIFNLEHIVSNTGTYYIWFKDSEGNTVSKSISVSNIDNTPPVCTFNSFKPNNIKNNENSVIEISCIDPETGIRDIDITNSNLNIDGNSIVITGINKSVIDNGYKYRVNIKGSNIGVSNISLSNNSISNKASMGNSIVVSSDINTIDNKTMNEFTITLSNSNYVYDGSKKEPSVTVVNGSNTLVEGTDYKLEYRNNINAGVGSVLVTGINDYLKYGSKSIEFTISKANCTCTINSNISSLTIGDNASINYTCTGNGVLEVSSNKNDVISIGGFNSREAILDLLEVGTARITVKKNENINYNSCSTYKDISVLGQVYTITYKDVGDTEFSGIHDEDYPVEYQVGTDIQLDMPLHDDYVFKGYYKDSNGTGERILSTINETTDLTLYAKWEDNIPPYGVANLSLQDGEFNLTLSNYGDNGSGLVNNYGFALINSGNCENATYMMQTGLSKTYNSDLVNNTSYRGCIKLTDNDGNVAYLESASIEYIYSVGSQLYTTVQEHVFTVPENGTYVLEVWGGQGGNNGGYGGYSKGQVTLSASQKLYINVGGAGNGTAAGFNGGGTATTGGYGGGGATHISSVSGRLSTFSSNINSIYIIAGGGGGNSNGTSGKGGNGGGIVGNNGVDGACSNKYGRGGTQTAGGVCQDTSYSINGSFGQGGSWKGGNNGGAGGGGYYGGASGTGGSCYGGGGGGSGYIGNSLLTDKVMYCYNCTVSNDVNTKTISMTNVSGTPTSNYAKSGNGAAKISWEYIENKSSVVVTYNNNGGIGCTSRSAIIGSQYGSLCVPVRNGYSFNGWYTSNTGGTQVLETTTVTSTENHTIYARWVESTNPVISFSNNGNSDYVKGNIISRVDVTKGSNNLDINSFKYIYSTDINAEPNISFNNGDNLILENATGIYYLIVKVCDIEGNCVIEKSNQFKVDNTSPYGVINLEYINDLQVEVNAIDNDSGMKEFGYLLSDVESCPTVGYVSSDANVYNLTLNGSGTYYVCVKLIDNAGNVSYINKNYENDVILYTEPGEYVYLPSAIGNYILEVWGAQGGNVVGGTNGGTTSSVSAGYGGYSVGSVFLDDNAQLYVNVGGKGTNNCISSSNGTIVSCNGGYNGGGTGYSSDYYRYVSGGGGATHIAKVSGLLSALSSQQNSILIVAGGGGGAGYYNYNSANLRGNGGSGGGYIANNGTISSSTTISSGGNQVSGYGFGLGESPVSNSNNQGYSGGGGGYYGGKSGSVNNTGAGGGSGYIGNSLLTNKVMYCYNCAESSDVSTKTISTTNVSETPTSNYAKSGNGAAKITWINNIKDYIIVSYDNNGGSGCSFDSKVVGLEYGELCTPTRNGYHFVGWYVDSNFNEQILNTSIVENENITLYAYWEHAINPNIRFDKYSNSGYVNGNISVKVDVIKGQNNLDTNSFKYIYSTDINAEPNISFNNGDNVVLENGTGIYYLIVKACDVLGNCVTKKSNQFYVDNISPNGNISLSSNSNVVNVLVNASDVGSGIANYGYLIQTSPVCPTAGYISTTNSDYVLQVTQNNLYYICVKISDLVGNYQIVSDSINIIDFSATYSIISTNYSCANSSVGTAPFFEYTGNCSIVQGNGEEWKINFLTSGMLDLNFNTFVDIFAVGGGGGGVKGGGGGGYTATYEMITVDAGEYQIVVGSGGSSGQNGGKSYFNDDTLYYANGGYAASDKNGGNGGSGGGGAGCSYCASYNNDCGYGCCIGTRASKNGASLGNSASGPTGDCFYDSNGTGGTGQGTTTCEFGLGTLHSCDTGVASYSRGGIGAESRANTGNGGNASSSGSSGIIILKSHLFTDIVVDNEVLGTYSGKLEQIDDGNGNWKVKFLTSGVLNLYKNSNLDLFLVGGGGGGSSDGAGGGGGYTSTYLNQSIVSGTYNISVGYGGYIGTNGGISYFDSETRYYANGGYAASGRNGGNGGSGGGASGCGYCASYNNDCGYGCCIGYRPSTEGATLGKSASSPTGECNYDSNGIGGTGQDTTTCEFGLGTTSACNTGITGYSQGGLGATSAKNTGNGGNPNSYGDSGIVIIRNKR